VEQPGDRHLGSHQQHPVAGVSTISLPRVDRGFRKRIVKQPIQTLASPDTDRISPFRSCGTLDIHQEDAAVERFQFHRRDYLYLIESD